MSLPTMSVDSPAERKCQSALDFFAKYDGKTDQFDFSTEIIKKWDPFFRFFYEDYFRVEVIGLENIPAEGPAVLVGNHSGTVPVDAFMLCQAMYNHHSAPRRIRFLTLDCLRSYPFVNKVIKGFGGVPASLAVANELLRNGELVFIYPEGARGTGKSFSMRYRLADFNPGFVRAAIASQAPIVTVTTVGGDEIYPLLVNLEAVAKLMGTPYWPITPTFPWFPFPVSCIPLPIKFLIKVGKPIHLQCPTETASDRNVRLQVAREIQYEIQRELNVLLKMRKSPWHGWDKQALRMKGFLLSE